MWYYGVFNQVLRGIQPLFRVPHAIPGAKLNFQENYKVAQDDQMFFIDWPHLSPTRV